MSFATSLRVCAATLFLAASSAAQSIPEINGNTFISPYNGQAVTGVSGVVTAKGPNGIWIQTQTPDDDPRTSEGIYVFARNLAPGVGDLITLDGIITEYAASAAYIPLAEITAPTNIQVLSSGNVITPLEIGVDVVPPTAQLSSLDNGDVFAVPNGQSKISVVNPTLDPTKYGLDFMESLLGMLVTIKAPVAVSRPNSFGDTWVVGDWVKTGQNERGGLTMTDGDVNPEAILIGDPLDGSDNPLDTVMGASLEDITGVVSQAFGFYRILPLTAQRVVSNPEPALEDATVFESTGTCSSITVGQYNVENLEPTSEHLPLVAGQIVEYMKTPDIVFVQEVQDNTGETDNGVVDGNQTLGALSNAIAAISDVTYSYVEIAPVNNQDGGAPGGNIRVAYLYNPEVVELHDANPGSATDAVEVLPGPALSFNPGRIAPTDPAWDASRKPLVAQWDLVSANSTFFTVNVHFGSKGGSASIQGDARTPINGGVEDRQAQAELTAALVADILAEDPEANVITAGDFNEFTFVEPLVTFAEVSGLKDLDVAAGIPPTERYSYLFDMNAQELDHMYVSPRIAGLSPGYEHIHVNTWATFQGQVSDHDPAVAKLNLCRPVVEPPPTSSSSSSAFLSSATSSTFSHSSASSASVSASVSSSIVSSSAVSSSAYPTSSTVVSPSASRSFTSSYVPKPTSSDPSGYQTSSVAVGPTESGSPYLPSVPKPSSASSMLAYGSSVVMKPPASGSFISSYVLRPSSSGMASPSSYRKGLSPSYGHPSLPSYNEASPSKGSSPAYGQPSQPNDASPSSDSRISHSGKSCHKKPAGYWKA